MPAPSRRLWLLSPSSSSLLSFIASIVSSLSSAASTPTPSIHPSFHCPSQLPQPFSSRADLPDRFEKGDDGLWRKDDVYTLYGSTICLTCKDPTAIVTDGHIQSHTNTPEPSSTNHLPLDNSMFDLDSLPPGWKPGGPTVKRTSLIIILSVALTSLICVSLVASLLYKRARSRRSLANVDLEMKLKKTKRKCASEEAKEKEGKILQKFWVRATARWKANARYTARQRRGKRGIVRAQLNSSTTSLNRRETASISSPTSPILSVLPPAYHDDTSDARSVTSGVPPLSSSSHPSFHLPHTAHVAIDDKAVLAQMVDLVSAPPSDSCATISGGSAPVWPDSEEETADADTPSVVEHSESHSGFPAPPSKGKISDSYFDFPYTLHDFEATEPESGPSAPPFAEADDMPSAPPIAYDPPQIEASAPDWDDDPLHDVYIDEEGQPHSAHHSSVSFTQDSTPSPVPGPIHRTRRPPSYHP